MDDPMDICDGVTHWLKVDELVKSDKIGEGSFAKVYHNNLLRLENNI